MIHTHNSTMTTQHQLGYTTPTGACQNKKCLEHNLRLPKQNPSPLVSCELSVLWRRIILLLNKQALGTPTAHQDPAIPTNPDKKSLFARP